MRIQKTLIALSIIAFLIVGAFGMGYSGTIMGHGEMGMTPCPLMSHGAAMCNMNPLEHVNTWQTMFAAIPAESFALSMLLIIATLAVSVFGGFLFVLAPSPQPIRIYYSPEIVTRDPLRRFLARGLLHPKVF